MKLVLSQAPVYDPSIMLGSAKAAIFAMNGPVYGYCFVHHLVRPQGIEP